MAVINVAGYAWRQCQSEAEWRLNQCFEFSGRFLTNSAKSTIPPAYKKCSGAKLIVWEKCVKIANDAGCAEHPVVTGKSTDFFTVSFYTVDPENNKPNRVFWITPSHKYYADIQREVNNT